MRQTRAQKMDGTIWSVVEHCVPLSGRAETARSRRPRKVQFRVTVRASPSLNSAMNHKKRNGAVFDEFCEVRLRAKRSAWTRHTNLYEGIYRYLRAIANSPRL